MVRSPRQPAVQYVEWDFTAQDQPQERRTNRRSAAPAGAEEPLPPTPSPQAPQPTAAAWLLAILQATNAARRGIAIQQPPQLIPLRRRIGRVLGHHRPYGRHSVRRPPAWRLGASGGRRMPGIRGRPIGGSRRRRTPDRCPTSRFATPSILS